MSQQGPPAAPEESSPQGDPWRAFSYLVGGVLLYGALGWLADQWLETSFLVMVGILLGAGLGVFMVFKTFGVASDQSRGEQ
ncbi:AtpZ/AtpI family protein [Nocardioides sp. SYSU DS0663]|uniref:AtpZ/AtpI family protein n=1 Tax=Nocardioides sp. SYSU DS0663 TaxID=3416445 RepID=UPI003F4BD49C